MRSFTEQELLGFVTRILQEKFQRGEPISQPAEFRALLTAQLGTREFEVF